MFQPNRTADRPPSGPPFLSSSWYTAETSCRGRPELILCVSATFHFRLGGWRKDPRSRTVSEIWKAVEAWRREAHMATRPRYEERGSFGNGFLISWVEKRQGGDMMYQAAPSSFDCSRLVEVHETGYRMCHLPCLTPRTTFSARSDRQRNEDDPRSKGKWSRITCTRGRSRAKRDDSSHGSVSSAARSWYPDAHRSQSVAFILPRMVI